MKFRTILLASAAVMFAGSAAAADLTNPFYLPGQGEFTSDTSVSYSRNKFKHGWGVDEQWSATEEVQYGVTDNFAVKAAINNEFDTQGEYNNDHNFDYTVGAAYNMSHGSWLGQVGLNYNTYDLDTWYGKKARASADLGGRWVKLLNANAKVGYDMGNGLTPYASFDAYSYLDDDDREMWYSTSAGIHKYAGIWAVDGAVRYDFQTEGKNANEWWVDAAADYYVRDNVAVGVFGSYFLGGTGSDDVDYNYDAGAHVKVLF